MITIKQLVDTYLTSKGLKRIKGEDNDASPLLPLIMMDSAYSLFSRYVGGLECHHEMKKLKGLWIESYNRFNRDYFRCYDEEETSAIVDMMDAFEEYIAKDMKIAFLQFTNLFKHEDIEKQKIISACLLANVLCQSAEIVWERVYASTEERCNRHIVTCERILHKWSDKFYGKDNKDVNPNESKSIRDAIDVLCRNQINFLRTYIDGSKNH